MLLMLLMLMFFLDHETGPNLAVVFPIRFLILVLIFKSNTNNNVIDSDSFELKCAFK